MYKTFEISSFNSNNVDTLQSISNFSRTELQQYVPYPSPGKMFYRNLLTGCRLLFIYWADGPTLLLSVMVSVKTHTSSVMALWAIKKCFHECRTWKCHLYFPIRESMIRIVQLYHYGFSVYTPFVLHPPIWDEIFWKRRILPQRML